MMKKVPILLIYLRLIFAFAILALAFMQPPAYKACVITMMVVGLVADIFDDIIARLLNIPTPRLRRLDFGRGSNILDSYSDGELYCLSVVLSSQLGADIDAVLCRSAMLRLKLY
jgi:hypothetical protein